MQDDDKPQAEPRHVIFGANQSPPQNILWLTQGRFSRGCFVATNDGLIGIVRDCTPDGKGLDVAIVDSNGHDTGYSIVPVETARKCYLEELPPGRARVDDEECIAMGYVRRPI